MRFLLIMMMVVMTGCSQVEMASHLSKVWTQPQRTMTQEAKFKVGNPYQIDGVWYTPRADWAYDETGIASWYGPGFHEKLTANGEIFDQDALTAAHPTLQIPSIVRVTNLENGRQINLRVNDRGPFRRGRVLDASRRAAELLGFKDKGTARVRVQVLREQSLAAARAMPGFDVTQHGLAVVADATHKTAPVTKVEVASLTPPEPSMPIYPNGDYGVTGKTSVVPVQPTAIYIQVGAFTQKDNALRLQQKLAAVGHVFLTRFEKNNMVFWRVRMGPFQQVEQADVSLQKVTRAGHPEAEIVIDQPAVL